MLAALVFFLSLPAAGEPISLHPTNPHYLLFRGRPTVLVSSTEHYGAVLNGEFDAIPYLDALEASGLNLTRTFSGTYREVSGSFNIARNTLAPKPDHYTGPWPRSKTAGAADGGNKFDLASWNLAYFERLKAFVTEAGERGIVVEFVLFCPFYEENLWDVNPMNARNNVNGLRAINRTEAYTLKHRDIQERQEAFVQKAVTELNEFDNVYFEICNEPYFGGVTLEWQTRIASIIVETEKSLPHKHLIAQNIANEKAKIERPDPAVSIFNFHYATPPETVAMNFALKKALGDDETGFRGVQDRPYRIEAWDFLVAGGAIFDHLDYSFTTDHEDGTANVLDPTPGGGGRTIRRQFQVLKEFIESFEFLKMAPDRKVIARVTPRETSVRALGNTGREYAIYGHGGTRFTLALELPAGQYAAEWLNPRTGKIDQSQRLQSRGRLVELTSPDFDTDIALGIRRVTPPGG
jgi:Putative collagen-binding domain of a collagenase